MNKLQKQVITAAFILINLCSLAITSHATYSHVAHLEAFNDTTIAEAK